MCRASCLLNEEVIVIYHARKGQTSSGEAIGILLLDSSVPFIPGDVANATTYDFPVRFQKVPGFTVARAIGKGPTIYDRLYSAAVDLIDQGVRAVTGDCGFMALHQSRLVRELPVPVFLSSLLQIPFIFSIIGDHKKIGVITADSRGLDNNLLSKLNIAETNRLVIEGLEGRKHFYQFAIEESGMLDSSKVEAEVIAAGQAIMDRETAVKAILLECSLLPPYAAALAQAVQVPVFDYINMINYVYSAVVKKRCSGYL